MDKKYRVRELHKRLKNIILNTCNKIGCKNCDLKWDDKRCQAMDVQDQLFEAEHGVDKNGTEK